MDRITFAPADFLTDLLMGSSIAHAGQSSDITRHPKERDEVMQNTLYAVIAASLAMFATSGIIALATAAPNQPAQHVTMLDADHELSRHLDQLIATHLADIRQRLDAARSLTE